MLNAEKKRLEQEICRGIVRIIKDSTGRGPVNSQAFLNENNILVITTGFMLPIEIELAKLHDCSEQVRLSRSIQAMAKKARYMELVSGILNRKPIDFFFDLNPKTNTAVGIVLFE